MFLIGREEKNSVYFHDVNSNRHRLHQKVAVSKYNFIYVASFKI